MTAAEVAGATGGLVAPASRAVTFTSYHTDSREVLPGGLFVALTGAALDGHRFVRSALERGAAGVLVSEAVQVSPEVAAIQVTDTWIAFYALARHVLVAVAPLVIGITGSNGKTSTKELVAAALGGRHRVHRTEGNLNTETGVPLTILALEPDSTALVLEMGMQGPGEIRRLADLAEPSTGVVTGIGSVHLEFFASQDELARAKGELVAALPESGFAVLNADDPYFKLLAGMTRARLVSFGLEGGEIRGSGYHPLAGGGCEFECNGVTVRLALEGRHQARNALAALAVAFAAGIPVAEAAPLLAEVRVGHRLEAVSGPGGSLLVDDAYNASPESMLAAFEALAERPRQGRLLAVLGEMRELGGAADRAHREVGERARSVFDSIAVLDVGRGRLLAEAAGAELLADLGSAANWVRTHAGAGDVVLIKASNGVRLFELVSELKS